MRRKFWLKLSIWVLVVLVVLYLGFWIAFFNPLEGSIERLDALVPKEAISWYVHGPWEQIRKSELLRRHFFDSPIRDEFEAQLELEQFLYRPIREIEAQINASVPSFVGEFSVLEDLIGREVAVAGNLTGPGRTLDEKALNSPYLVLTRISFKSRFMDVLKYDAVRENVPGLEMHRDFYRYDVGAEAIRPGAPEEARYFYFQRVKDVLILSNNRDLMEGALHFGRAGGVSSESLPQHWWFYYDTQGPRPENSVLVWIKVREGPRGLYNEVEEFREPAREGVGGYLRAFFPLSEMISVTLRPGIEGEDTIPLTGVVRIREDLDKHLYDLHRKEARPLAPVLNDAASWLPADRTFAMVHLKMAASDFVPRILPIFEDTYAPGRAENGGGTERWTAEELGTRLGSWFDEGVTIGFTRLPEVDRIDLDSYAGGDTKPLPATTLILNVVGGVDPQDLPDFFRRNKVESGLGEPEERETRIGRLFAFPLTTDKSLLLLRPGCAILDRTVLFSTNVDELARLLEVKAGGGTPLTASGDFRDALATAPQTGSIFFFLDMQRARSYILDQRYQYAFDAAFFNERTYRTQVIIDLTKENPRWTNQQRQEEADRRLDRRWVQAKQVDFPDAIRRFRNNMIWYEPFRWIAVSLTPGGDTAREIRLDLQGAIRLESQD